MTTSLRIGLFFPAALTGVNADKSPYIRSTDLDQDPMSSNRNIEVSNFLELEGVNETYISFTVEANATNLLQKFLQQADTDGIECGIVTGVVEIEGNRLFFPQRGAAWVTTGTPLVINVQIVGLRRRYLA